MIKNITKTMRGIAKESILGTNSAEVLISLDLKLASSAI